MFNHQPMFLSFNIVMLRPDDTNRAFQADAEFRKIIFSVSDPNSVANTLEHLGRDQPIISTMFKAATDGLNSARLTVTLSAGHSNKNLHSRGVKNILRLLQRASGNGAPVEKLIAKGAFGGENAEMNFLPNKMCFEDTIRAGRLSIPFRDRAAALMRARAHCLPKLNELFARDMTVIRA